MYRIVLDEAFDLGDDLESYGVVRGWTYLGDVQAKERGAHQVHFQTADGERVICAYDAELRVPYLDVETEELVDELTANMPVVMPGDLVSALANASNTAQRKAALRYAVVGLGAPEPELVEAAVKMSHEDDPQLRWEAAYMMTYTEMSAFRDRLAEMAASDPDEEVRQQSEIFLEALEEIWDKKAE